MWKIIPFLNEIKLKKLWKKVKHPLLRRDIDEYLFLFVIFGVSFLFRRIGLKFGFPLLTHADEPVILENVYQMTANRTLQAENLIRPDQILYFVNFIYLNLISLIKFGKSLTYTFVDNQIFFYFYARLLIAFIGSWIPIVAFKIGKEFDTNFSIPAAIVFAFFPFYVIHSHFVTPDIPITLFTLVVILFSIRYIKTKKEKHLYLAIIFAAINTAEKYPGLLSLGVVIVALFLDSLNWEVAKNKFDFRKLFKKFTKTIGIYLLSLFIVAPNIFIQYGKVFDALISESRTTHLGADNLSWWGNVFFYIDRYIYASNLLFIIYIIIGFWALFKIKNKGGVLLLYGFAYWIILSKLGLHWVRWALPMYTAPLLLGSLGIAFIWSNFKNKNFCRYLVVAIILIAFTQQLITSLANSARMGFTDTRVVALDYLEQNGISAENSFFEGYTPFLPQYPKVIFEADIDNKDDSIKYVVLSSQMYERFFDEAERYKEEVSFYNDIKSNQRLIKEFSPTPEATNIREKFEDITYYFLRYFKKIEYDRYIGPTINIYKINNE